MVGFTAIALALGSLPLIAGSLIVWVFWIARFVLLTQVLDPRGESTPSVNQHSNIAAMVARGEFAKAVEAYQAAIAADPGDVVACEHLALLARRELKDYARAVAAYREAERREPEPRRRLGYALHVVGILRDDLKDGGRTIVELRRVLDTYPDAPNAPALRADLEQVKAGRFGAT
jgi:tetratricopeptide (TPR) repeat protein